MGQLAQQAAQITLHAILFHLVAGEITITSEQFQQLRVVAIAHFHLKAHRLTGTAHQILDVVFGQFNELGEFADRGGTAQLLAQLPLTFLELVQHLRDVNRQSDGAALLRDRTGDALTDPPVGVGGKFVTTGGVEFLDTPHQTDGAFLDQIQKFHVPLGVLLGNTHHQAQIGRHHPLLGATAVLQFPLELKRGEAGGLGQLVG